MSLHNNKHIYTGLLALLLLFSMCKKKSEPEVTKETGTVTDRQGNVYNTVKIGDQWWMTENLRVEVYNDSTPIKKILVGDTLWRTESTGAFCPLDTRFGLHYNWYAVHNTKKIAPAGWHIPSDYEWKVLESHLGMNQDELDKTSWRGSVIAEKLMPEGSDGWPASSVNGTNESGFSALPGGCRLFNGTAGEVNLSSYWWTSIEKTSGTAWYRCISINHNNIFRYYVNKNYGLTIRCVKD